MKFRNQGQEPNYLLSYFLNLFVIKLNSRFIEKLINAGEIASYFRWIKNNFGLDIKFYKKRENIFDLIPDYINNLQRGGGEFLILELGVAYGYTTNYLLNKIKSKDLMYLGLDRFTGLPRNWRNLNKGHFDTGGRPPEIKDTRVRFLVGDVEKTILTLDKEIFKRRKLIIFDLDLYEPSKFVFDYIENYLSPGDLLYFDEAFDLDEKKLIEEKFFLKKDLKYRVVAYTPLAVCLEII